MEKIKVAIIGTGGCVAKKNEDDRIEIKGKKHGKLQRKTIQKGNNNSSSRILSTILIKL